MEAMKLSADNNTSKSNLFHKLNLEALPEYNPTVPYTQAISPKEFKQKYPDVKFRSIKYISNNECVKKLGSEKMVHYEPTGMTTAISPYEYIQNGGKMIVNYTESYMYLMPTFFKLSVKDKIKEFKYNNFNSILYWISFKDGEKHFIRLANFEIEIIHAYTLVSLRNEQKMLSILVRGKDNRQTQIEIFLEKYESLYQEIIKENPEYRLYPDSKKETLLFRQYCSEVYEYNHINLFDERVYLNAGWHKYNGSWRYYSGNGVDCLSKFRLADKILYSRDELAEWFRGLLELADIHIMLPLLIHAHLGYTLKLFEDAGYDEQYILAIIGESGSKKTSLARVMFNLFGGEEINFTSTDRAIELELENRQDSVMVLDDLSSGSDKFLTKKFENILRQLGDSTGRKKSVNSGKEQEQVNTRCAVVLTAETDIDSLSKSSKLRTLAVHMCTDSLNLAKLSEYQKEIHYSKVNEKFSKLEQYMTLYIRFLEKYYQFIVNELVEYRYIFTENFTFDRQATIFRILAGQSKIILHFWKYCNLLPETDIEVVYKNWCEYLKEIVQMNEQRGLQIEPHLLFLNAVIQFATSEGVIANDKFTFEKNKLAYIGFFKNEYLFLNPDLAYNYAVSYCEKQAVVFNANRQDIWNKLYQNGVIEGYEQKNHKAKLFRQVMFGTHSEYFLCLNLDIASKELKNLVFDTFL